MSALGRIPDEPPAELGARPNLGVAEVDPDARPEPQRLRIRDHELGGVPVDTPERRAEAVRRPLLGTVEPERPGDVRPQHGPLVQRDERDDALCTARQRHLLARDFDAEPRQQMEHDLLGGTVKSPRNVGDRPQG